MMKLFCIEYLRETKDGKTMSKFFVYDKTRINAFLRFLITTGYNKRCVIKMYEIEDD